MSTAPVTAGRKPADLSDCRKRDLECRLAKIADAGPAAIDDRLRQLDWEWTAGRMTKAATGGLIVLGLALVALTGNPWWLALPAAGGLFLLQYSFSRTSWLAKVFGEMGYRTGAEVEHEKFALRTIRGDFRHLPTIHDIEEKDDIGRLEGEGGIVVEEQAHKIGAATAAHEVVRATTPV
ncbi:MAG: hypothetical protein K2X87_23605 [Gemmataceae bacterium]|nr:hypothetical protein [Gemmataceae bacterium]